MFTGTLTSWTGSYGFIVPDEPKAVGFEKVFVHILNRRVWTGKEFKDPEAPALAIFSHPKAPVKAMFGNLEDNGKPYPNAKNWALEVNKLKTRAPLLD